MHEGIFPETIWKRSGSRTSGCRDHFPLSVALAIASGLSPEKGLYTAIIGGFFVSAFGGSKVNIGGATAATVMTVFTIVEKFGLAGLAPQPLWQESF